MTGKYLPSKLEEYVPQATRRLSEKRHKISGIRNVIRPIRLHRSASDREQKSNRSQIGAYCCCTKGKDLVPAHFTLHVGRLRFKTVIKRIKSAIKHSSQNPHRSFSGAQTWKLIIRKTNNRSDGGIAGFKEIDGNRFIMIGASLLPSNVKPSSSSWAPSFT